MEYVIQHVIDAVSLGSLYALLALGVALVFGIMQLVNFAYGELIMIGAYAIFLFSTPPWPVLLLGTVAVVVIAAISMERVAFRPVRGADPTTLLVTSFALSFLFQNLALLIFGSKAKTVSLSFFTETVAVGGVTITKLSIMTVLLAAVLVSGLVLFLRRSSLGIQMRAAAEDFEMTRALGVRANGVIVTAFALSGALAGVASILLVGQTGTITPVIGLTPVIIAFVATVIGGMGSLPGALVGGYLLGCLSVLLQVVLPLELRPYRDAFLFGIVILILVFRPQGLIVPRGRVERI